MVRAAGLALLLAGLGFAAAGCGSSGGGIAAATTTTTTTTTTTRTAAFQAFQTCLASKGVRLPSRPFGQGFRPRTATTTTPGTRPRGGFFTRRNLSPAQQKAFQTCRSKLPAGGRFGPGGRGRPFGSRNPAFAKYTQCLAKHGVKFGGAGDRTKFAKAQAACRPLLPARTAASG